MPVVCESVVLHCLYASCIRVGCIVLFVCELYASRLYCIVCMRVEESMGWDLNSNPTTQQQIANG